MVSIGFIDKRHNIPSFQNSFHISQFIICGHAWLVILIQLIYLSLELCIKIIRTQFTQSKTVKRSDYLRNANSALDQTKQGKRTKFEQDR